MACLCPFDQQQTLKSDMLRKNWLEGDIYHQALLQWRSERQSVFLWSRSFIYPKYDN